MTKFRSPSGETGVKQLRERIVKLAMQAQLGNQMFQYAAIRSHAESTGSRFIWGYPRTTIGNHLRLLFGRMRRPPIRLRQYFKLTGDTRIQHSLNQIDWCLRRLAAASHVVVPEYEELAPQAFSEKLVNLSAISNKRIWSFRAGFSLSSIFLTNEATY